MDLDKDVRIKKEFLKVRRLFKDIEKNKKTLAEKWMQQLAFMTVTLEDLQIVINREGAVKEGTNGNGFTVYQEHPATKSYNTMIRNYNGTLKHLVDMLPEGEQQQDALVEFLQKRKQ